MTKVFVLISFLIGGNWAFNTNAIADEKGGEVGNPISNNFIGTITCGYSLNPNDRFNTVILNANGESKVLMKVSGDDPGKGGNYSDDKQGYCLRMANNLNRVLLKTGSSTDLSFKCVPRIPFKEKPTYFLYSIGVQFNGNEFETIGDGSNGMFRSEKKEQCEDLANRLNENFDGESIKSRSVASKGCAEVSDSKEKKSNELSIINSARNLSKEVQPEVKEHISPVSKTSDK